MNILPSGQVEPLNRTEIDAVDNGISEDTKMLDFVDGDSEEHVALLAPKHVDLHVDYEASSFGISTQCRAIPASACEMFPSNETTEMYGPTIPFACNESQAGIDISGRILKSAYQARFLDFHAYIQELPAFQSMLIHIRQINESEMNKAMNLSEEEAAAVFRNPWHWVVFLKLQRTYEDAVSDSLLWYARFPGIPEVSYLMLHCNSTGSYLLPKI